MNDVFSTHRIYVDSDSGKQCIIAISFLLDDILDLSSSKGAVLSFEDDSLKTRVTLTGDRTYWVLEPYPKLLRRWKAYLSNEDEAVFLCDMPVCSN
jgi:hypothetical protein